MVDQHREESDAVQPTEQGAPIDHGIPIDQRTQAERDAIVKEQGPRPMAKAERQALAKRDKRGRLVGHTKLSEKAEALACYLADGMPIVEAGRRAGYADYESSASRARRTPAVAARVVELQRMRLGRAGALAIRTIERIMTGDIAAPASVMLDAAKHTLKLNGIELQAEKGSNTKDLRSMTMDELLAIAATFKARTDPVRPGDDAQAVDIIEQSTT